MFDHPTNAHRLTSPRAVLVAALATAAILAALPAPWSAWLKGEAARAALPGQRAAQALRERTSSWIELARAGLQSSARLAEAEHDLAALRDENRQLAAELAALRNQSAALNQAKSDDSADRLLRVAAVDAHVLGRQALAFLGRQRMLDVGTRAGVYVDAPVAAGLPAIIDRGQDSGLASGRLVLSAGRIWGRIAEVGRSTSLVRTATDPGYRDLVRLASPGSQPSALERAPEGMLEGTGQPLARIRRVAVTEPVAVGDLVYTAAEQGALAEPLCYGRIVRVERPVGAAHWDIWMQLDMAGDTPDRVAVLRVELNPLRAAATRISPLSRAPTEGWSGEGQGVRVRNGDRSTPPTDRY